MMKSVLVIGSTGQLGQAFRYVLQDHDAGLDCVFYDRAGLDITDLDKVRTVLLESKPDYCLNFAAYTLVDKAEEQRERAFEVNAQAVGHLASCCEEAGVTLVHISTDFVFDGKSRGLYLETDPAHPLNVYGESKLAGERLIGKNCRKHYIIRTSWLYSPFGHNFFKTMLRLGSSGRDIDVVDDQIGCPTYALDLAKGLMELLQKEQGQYGVYHFSNKGACSWFEFAKEIFSAAGQSVVVRPVSAESFGAPAKRPAYSTLDTRLFESTFAFPIPDWKESLRAAIALEKVLNTAL